MQNDDVIIDDEDTIDAPEYLDDSYGEEKLFGTDPMKKALQRLWVQDFEKKVSKGIMMKMLLNYILFSL